LYLPQADGTPDGVGADRYRVGARRWTGADLEPQEAYDWGWSQFRELQEQMRAEAQRVLPGASAQEAMLHLDQAGEAIEGVEEIRAWLQDMMDRAIADLDGTHFDLATPLKTVEARIAPPGSAAAPVLHHTIAGILAARPDLAADARPDQVPAVELDQHVVPRGCSRPSPAARANGGTCRRTCRCIRQRSAAA